MSSDRSPCASIAGTLFGTGFLPGTLAISILSLQELQRIGKQLSDMSLSNDGRIHARDFSKYDFSVDTKGDASSQSADTVGDKNILGRFVSPEDPAKFITVRWTEQNDNPSQEPTNGA